MMDIDRLHEWFQRERRSFPFLFEVLESFTPSGYEWIEKEKLLFMPFFSGHRRILEKLYF